MLCNYIIFYSAAQPQQLLILSQAPLFRTSDSATPPHSAYKQDFGIFRFSLAMIKA